MEQEIAIATIPQFYVDDTDNGGLNSMYPTPNETPQKLVDGQVSTKYLNFDKLNTGFTVSPRSGLTIVSGITLTSANDAPERDPASYTLSGSYDGTNFTDISSGTVAPVRATSSR